jgi:hypothetical protein
MISIVLIEIKCLNSKDLFQDNNQNFVTNNEFIKNINKCIESIQNKIDDINNICESTKKDHEIFKNYCFNLFDLMKNSHRKLMENDMILNAALIGENIDKVHNIIVNNDKQVKTALQKIYHKIHETESKINNMESKLESIEKSQQEILLLLKDIMAKLNK